MSVQPEGIYFILTLSLQVDMWSQFSLMYNTISLELFIWQKLCESTLSSTTQHSKLTTKRVKKSYRKQIIFHI